MNRHLEIETMIIISRSIHRNISIYDICNKQSVIESLNLHCSLKNLTVEFHISRARNPCYKFDHIQQLHQQSLENILKKEFYYQLKNVNIMIHVKQDDNGVCRDYDIDWIFKLLKKYKQILKYQFKELNIAICKTDKFDTIKVYYALKWNPKIDDKILQQEREKYCQMSETDDCQQDVKQQHLKLCSNMV